MEEERQELINRMHKQGVSHFEGLNHFTAPIERLRKAVEWLEKLGEEDEK